MDGSAGRKKTHPLNAKIIELYILKVDKTENSL
jgi:hypothetical protein